MRRCSQNENPRGARLKIVDEARLEAARERFADAANSLDAWRINVKAASWQHSMEVKKTYRTADYASESGWIFFNIKRNHYRLATVINYQDQTVTIVDLYNHKEYDKL